MKKVQQPLYRATLLAVLLCASVWAGATGVWALHTTAADQHSETTGERRAADVQCVNGGVPDENGNCICPLYYTGSDCAERQCPNSVGGKGPNRVLPVTPATKFCDHCDSKQFDGLSCQLCQRNEACVQFKGANAVCDNSIMIRGDSKQFQCTLKSPYFIHLMGDGRNITAEIMLNCSTHDGKAFSKSKDGTCTMAIYRVEPERAYLDPFFRCEASSCSLSYVDPDPDDNDKPDDEGKTTSQKFFDMVRPLGQVVLVGECVALAALGGFASLLGHKRMKKLTVVLGSLLSFTVVLYVVLMMISMRPTYVGAQAIAYDCKKTRCACAEDPPSVYQPICSESDILSKQILPSIQNSIRFVCGTSAKDCHLTLSDLSLVFEADCKAAECVDATAFPDPSGDNTGGHGGAAILARQNLGILLVLLCILVVACVYGHYYYTESVSHDRGNEFLVTFHVNTPHDDMSGTGSNSSGNGDGSGRLGRTSQGPADEGEEEEDDYADAGGFGQRAPATDSRTLAQRLLLRSPSRNSRFADSVVTVRESVYEQASALSPEECARIERIRQLTASSLQLTVSDLRYTLIGSRLGAAEDAGRRAILQGINFSVRSGDVLAIMGASGAGKTTLLDLLSARAKAGTVEGALTLNGAPITFSGQRAAEYRNIIGYVSQEDTLLPALTVKQTIRYAAQLKLPKALSENTVDRIVNRIIETLKLQRCANTIVGGDSNRGISGGEKRRVSIAVELLANPRILFLDEPTSGLDTISAKRVIEAVVELAKDSPMRRYAPHYFAFRPIVIFSIHQPSQEIYDLFDKVLILSRGASVYCGNARMAAATLETRVTAAFGHTRSVPRKDDHVNQAEYVMKLEEMLDDGVRAELQRADNLQNVGSATEVTRRDEDGVPDDVAVNLNNGVELMAMTMEFRVYYANAYEQVHLLISRAFTCLVSSYHLIMCHAGVVACMASLMCVLYNGQALDLPGSLNRAGSVSFLLLVTSFVSLSCLEQLIVERKLFVVERENGYYTSLPYLVSKIVVDVLPLRIIPAMVLASVIYFPMGFRVDEGIHFFWFVVIMLLFAVCITLFILCIGILSGSFGSAALLSSVFILWNFVFGGALVQAETIPQSLKPFKSLSPFFLAFESLMVNELNGQRCVFSPTDETGKPSSASIPIMCVQYLANVGLKPERFNADVLQLALYCIALVMLAWLLIATCTRYMH